MKVSVIRSNRKTVCIQITKEAEVIVRAPQQMAMSEIRAFVESKKEWIQKHLEKAKIRNAEKQEVTQEEIMYLTNEAKRILPQKVAHYAKIIGVTYGRITIRHQKTRWGSCSSKGNLNFNCMLMKMPSEIQDYVVVHELCHRKEMNHSPRFWKEVEKVMPDYKNRRKWLKERQIG